MFAKRLALACSAVGALMTAVPAQSPPEPLPAPRPVVAAPPVLPTALPEDRRRLLLRFSSSIGFDRERPAARVGERVVVAQALCVRVSADFPFAELLGPPSANGSWSLPPREARLLAALLAADPMTEVITRPQLTLSDDQTGFFRVGGQQPLVTGLRVETKNGTDVYTAQVTTAELGMILRLTPKIAADGRTVRLRAEAETRELKGSVLPVIPASYVTDGGTVVRSRPTDISQVGTAVSVQTVQTTVEVPTGGTAVVCSTDAEAGQGLVVWLLTPHVIDGRPTAK